LGNWFWRAARVPMRPLSILSFRPPGSAGKRSPLCAHGSACSHSSGKTGSCPFRLKARPFAAQKSPLRSRPVVGHRPQQAPRRSPRIFKPHRSHHHSPLPLPVRQRVAPCPHSLDRSEVRCCSLHRGPHSAICSRRTRRIGHGSKSNASCLLSRGDIECRVLQGRRPAG